MAAEAPEGSADFNSTEDDGEKRGNVGFAAEEEEDEEVEILPGAKLGDPYTFSCRKNGKTVAATPILVDFRRILPINAVEVIPGVSNKSLLHAVIGLFDVSLNEMTPDVLYATVCSKYARTMMLIRDAKDALHDINRRKLKSKKSDPEECVDEQDADAEEEEDVFKGEQEKANTFESVFSDSEESESSDSDSDEEDFSKGINAFLKEVKARKAFRANVSAVPLSNVGIEDRLVGALSFEKKYCKPSERIVHLTLIAVRKRLQHFGIGKYLLQKTKDTSVVGNYDAIVVHADNSALQFFERYGFTDDIVLNSRWSEFAEQFTNCTLMCYLPPFTNEPITETSLPELDLTAMEKEIKKWREKSIESFRSEMSCMNRMRYEIIHLRALVTSQQILIASLASANESVRQDKMMAEKRLLEFKLASFHSIHSDDDDDTEAATSELIRELEMEARAKAQQRRSHSIPSDDGEQNQYMVTGRDAADDGEPYDHGIDTEDFFRTTKEFYKAMKIDSTVVSTYEITGVSKAILPPNAKEEFANKVSTLKDPDLITRLYYCGSLEEPQRLTDILKEGFSEQDFAHGDYGRGLYFTKYPSKAAQFSAMGRLLVADVALGTIHSVVQKCRGRTQAPDHADSILTTGRLISAREADGVLCQEYVIFDALQALPCCVIQFSPKSGH